ncbi:hypothetical protein ACLMJK_004147 [Lecanora helva]
MENFHYSTRNITEEKIQPSQLEAIGFSPIFVLFPIILYLLLVFIFRHHRLRQLLEDYPYTTRRSLRDMTNEDAFFIQQIIGELEFPFTFEKALQFALFRTYGIPSISKLLVETRQFSQKGTSTKRYTDTVVLIAEFAGYHPQSERSIEAIARMNFIHHQYQKSGKISNDDMLYTLSLFAGEPVRWIDKYEWRRLEDPEKCAIGTFWKAMGDAMGIGYEKLKSGGDGGEGWRDGLQWFEEVVEWAEGYEMNCMVPDQNNRDTADHTVDILLWSVPNLMKPFGRKVVSALMDDRLRKAMIFEQPPTFHFALVNVLFTIRKLFIRFLCLPRPFPLRVHNPTDEPSCDGRYFMTNWETEPWYVQPTFRNRWCRLQSWASWAMGLPVPGDGGDKYWPQGYKIHEIGPESMRGKGESYVRGSRETLVDERMKGCPFSRTKRD